MFVQNSLKDLTISKIASNAGISKGILYDYFENKEEIVFELLNIMLSELREIYKDFISINLTTPNENMKTFQSKCFTRYFNWMCEIIQDGIDNGEIIPESIHIANGIDYGVSESTLHYIVTKIEKILNI